ncbi:MAG: response regulator [Deltaproteobacteria bacterium]|nr:response regulator [Deltaproteobacteria bacterium]
MPKKLLLADDSITIQKVISITFASEDFVITVVGDGDSAIKKAKETVPDIILADVAMPGKSGYEVCNAVKGDPALKNIPVMLLAGTFEPLNKAEAAKVKADDSIVKPFESQELIDKVKNLLAKAKGAPAAAPVIEEAGMEIPLEEGPEIIAAEPAIEPAGEEIMLGEGENFLGFGEEEQPAKPAPQQELIVAEEAGGFMDLEFGEEELKPQKAAPPPPPQRPVTPPPPPRQAAPPPPPPRPIAPPPPRQAAPPPPPIKEDVFTFGEPEGGPSFEPFTAEPVEEPALSAETFWAEPAANVPAPEEPTPPEPAADIWQEEPAVPRPPKQAPPPPLEGVRPRPAAPPHAAEASFAMRDAQKPVIAQVVNQAVKQAAERITAEAAERLKGVSGYPREQVEQTIERIAREVIEEIAWEIVPELAEELLAFEIGKFKDIWAKSR